MSFFSRNGSESGLAERKLSTQEIQLLGFATMAQVIRSETRSQARPFANFYRRLVRQVLRATTYPSLNPDRNLRSIHFAPFERRLAGAALDSAHALVQDPEKLDLVKHHLDLVAASESEVSAQILPLPVQYESDDLVADIEALQARLSFGKTSPA